MKKWKNNIFTKKEYSKPLYYYYIRARSTMPAICYVAVSITTRIMTCPDIRRDLVFPKCRVPEIVSANGSFSLQIITEAKSSINFPRWFTNDYAARANNNRAVATRHRRVSDNNSLFQGFCPFVKTCRPWQWGRYQPQPSRVNSHESLFACGANRARGA